MKQIVYFFFTIGWALLPILSSVKAFAETTFGYTNESVDAGSNFRLGSSKSQAIAIRLSHDKLQLFRGKTISQIRTVMGARNSTNNAATLFITTALDATPLVSQDITIETANEFVSYPLTTPYVITGDEEELYIGFSLEIGTSYGPFSADHSADSKGLCFARSTNGWQDLYGKGYGMANIELVFAEDVSYTDLMLKSFSNDGYLKVDTAYDYNLELVNLGTTTLNDFDIKVAFKNQENEVVDTPQTLHFNNKPIAPHGTFTISIPTTSAPVSGPLAINISIENAKSTDGELVENEPSDNQSVCEAYFYSADMQKKVLVEAFTAQTCTNCPSGHYAMKTAIENTGVPAVNVSHHSGFVEDRYSMKEDWDILNLYDSSTYAPAATVNRSKLGKNSSPVFDPQSISGTSDILLLANETKPYVSIALDADYDANTKAVDLKAYFYTHEQIPGSELRYTIYLVQDGLVGPQSNGGNDYVHNAVCRGCITEGSWGETADFVPGELLTIEKSFVLPDTIVSTYYTKNPTLAKIPTVFENMRIVAFVHQYSARDVNSNKVFNCEEVRLGEQTHPGGFPVGIESISAKSVGTTPRVRSVDGHLVVDAPCDSISVYTLSGKRITNNALSPGIYIVRIISKGRTFTQKISI